jgi:hypothetical protein
MKEDPRQILAADLIRAARTYSGHVNFAAGVREGRASPGASSDPARIDQLVADCETRIANLGSRILGLAHQIMATDPPGPTDEPG